jgi:two-component system sensor histidine kinase HydH
MQAMDAKDQRHKPFNLSRSFLLLSLVTIALVSFVSSIMLSRFLTDRMLQQDAEIMMGFVQGVVKVEDATGYFLRQRADDKGLEDFFTHIASMPDVVRANVYAQDKTILWSSGRDLIGKKFDSNPDLDHALAGELEIESGIVGEETQPKPEHILLGQSHMRFVEIYLPVRGPDRSTIIGVVEVYRIPNTLFAAIRAGHRMIWAIAFLGGLFLFVTLFWTVRRADQLIRNQQERLVESETLVALGEMSSAVAHGIRNPLASIRSSAELWHDIGGAHDRESAQDIIFEVDRLEKWVRDLLTYSQPHDEQLEAVELEKVLRESFNHFERETSKRGVTVHLQLGEQLPRIKGNSALLGQVFNNLIANALEAMHSGGEIRVHGKLAHNGGHIELRISDNGEGIPADQLERVFDAFYTTKKKGLGVGLALGRRIVKRFGGSMGIESRHGEGTAVTLNLLLANRP